MPRANRLFDRGGIWHITHRCHKKEYLLKFARDRSLWRRWLFEAVRRYGLSVLDFIATSNHVHLLVTCDDSDTIPRSMQLAAGRTAQSYNQRKNRRGAFWEDRYHAIPIRTKEHFIECLVYIDLNMVRAGRVSHPEQWSVAGYNEIQMPRNRYVIIDYERLAALAGESSLLAFQRQHRRWVTDKLLCGPMTRDERWTGADPGRAWAWSSFSGSKIGFKPRVLGL